LPWQRKGSASPEIPDVHRLPMIVPYSALAIESFELQDHGCGLSCVEKISALQTARYASGRFFNQRRLISCLERSMGRGTGVGSIDSKQPRLEKRWDSRRIIVPTRGFPASSSHLSFRPESPQKWINHSKCRASMDFATF
jgi:hypothetical protein